MSKNVLLVHGGHTGAWEWQTVMDELRRRGVQATAIDLPTRQQGATLADDEQAIRTELNKQSDSVVLVGHSYSGAVITAASANNAKVSHLVYVAAALPLEGQSVASALAGELQSEDVPAEDADTDWLSMDADTARSTTYNDATEEEFESVRYQLGKFSYRALSEVPSGFGWKEHPSTFLICTLDQSFPPETQRRFASYTNEAVEVEAGHSPMLTKPRVVADVIAHAASSAETE